MSESEESFPLLELPPRYIGPSMSFWVLSRSLVRRAAPQEPYIVISITNPGFPVAEIKESPHRLDVLSLQFHDTGDYGQPLNEQMVMTEEDARRIVAFTAGYQDRIKAIVCQCEAGVSRSAGVAAALSHWLNGEDGDRFFRANYSPNRWVYRLVSEAIDSYRTLSEKPVRPG